MNNLDLRVELRRDVAIVYLGRAIDDRLIIDCIAAIDELVDKYDYRKVELQIVSSGGAASSMDYFLEEIGKWERKTTIVTRALTNAQSAAAIILSLGNERRAGKRSRLQYHNSRTPIKENSLLTARAAETLANSMRPLDEEMVERLATRACEISRDDWKSYLEEYLKKFRDAKSSSRESDFNEHVFCARLFNLPVERLVCVLLSDAMHAQVEHWFALPAMSGATGTVGGAGSSQVFKPDEFWNYVRLSFASGTMDQDDVGALNTIVENALGRMREDGEENKKETVQKLGKNIGKYLGHGYEALGDEIIEIPGTFEEIAETGLHGFFKPLDESQDVEVELSPEWKTESLMAALLDMDGNEDSASDGYLKDKLCTLYRNLFEMDQPISPRVAKAFGLIDGIGDEKAFARNRDSAGPETEEQPFREKIARNHNALPAYEWRSLYPNGVTWENLCRHTLILGETGSGKSKSGILPLVKAVVEAANEATKSEAKLPVGCLLVIDPKEEIGAYLDAWAKHRKPKNVKIHKLHENAKHGHRRICLDLMAHEELSKDFNESYYLDRAYAIFRMVASLIPNHATGVLLNKSRGGTNDFWDQQGTRLASILVAVVLMLNDIRGMPGGRKVAEGIASLKIGLLSLDQERKLVELVEDAARGERNILHSSKRLLGIFGSHSGIRTLQKLLSELAEITAFEEEGPLSATTLRGISNELDTFLTDSVAESRTLESMLFSTNNCFFQIADGVIARTLFFGIEPGWEKKRSKLEFHKAVEIDKGNLDVFIYSPDLSRSDSELIGRSLKASYFASVLNDPDRKKGLDRKPGNSDDAKSFVGYIADEFHRFITDDLRHGEQSFLDTCRSFGGFCTLACQSVESMRHALLSFNNSGGMVDSSIGILLNNTATKLFFRATDSATMDRLSALLPDGTWGPVLRWQPLSMLSPGECYAVLVDGRIERRQLDWVRGAPSAEQSDCSPLA